MHPEILEMENIEYIASFITANMFELVDDGTSFVLYIIYRLYNTKIFLAFWKAAVEADQIDLKTLSELIGIGKQDKYEKQVVAKKQKPQGDDGLDYAERGAGGWGRW